MKFILLLLAIIALFIPNYNRQVEAASFDKDKNKSGKSDFQIVNHY